MFSLSATQALLRLVFCLAPCLLQAGCLSSQNVKAYPGPDLPDSKVAILSVYLTCGNPSDKKLWIEVDGQRYPLDSAHVTVPLYPIRLKILPGSHQIAWSLHIAGVNGRFNGSGTFTADVAKRYHFQTQIIVDRKTYDSLRWDALWAPGWLINMHKPEAAATWLEDEESGQVVAGVKPAWAQPWSKPAWGKGFTGFLTVKEEDGTYKPGLFPGGSWACPD